MFSKRGRRKVFSKQKAMNEVDAARGLYASSYLCVLSQVQRDAGRDRSTPASVRHDEGGGVTVSMPPLSNVFSLRYSGYY